MRENWKIGKYKSTVVSDTKQKNTNFPIPPNKEESDDSDKEYYGGYLVCESIGNKDAASLISAAPDLYRALKKLYEKVKFEPLDNRTRVTVEKAIKKANNET